MRFSILIALAVLAGARPALGQSAAPEIRATGVHTAVRGDTPELARQLAHVDGQRKVWRAAVAQLQLRSDIKALRLTQPQLDAFTAVIVEANDVPPSTAARGGGTPTQLTLRARFAATDAARQMAALKSDPDASLAIVARWNEMQTLYGLLADQTRRRAAAATKDQESEIAREQLQTLQTLTIKQLAARIAAAMARTQPATVGGRVVTDAGRQLAGRLAEQARALAPDSPDVHSLMGDMLLDAERLDEAEASYRKALAAMPDSSIAHHKLAEVLRLGDKFDASIAELRETLRLNPKSAAAHTDLGLIFRAQGKIEESAAEYREAIRIDPDWADAHNGFAVLLATQGRPDLAVEEFKEIVRIDPNSTIGYFNLATALADVDRDVEAAAALREVIRIYPDHYNAHYNLGEMFRLEGKFDESAKQFKEYVRLAPNTPQTQRNLRRARQFIEQYSD